MLSIKEYYLRSHGLSEVIENLNNLPPNLCLIKVVKHKTHTAKVFFSNDLLLYSMAESNDGQKIISQIVYHESHDLQALAAIQKFLNLRKNNFI